MDRCRHEDAEGIRGDLTVTAYRFDTALVRIAMTLIYASASFASFAVMIRELCITVPGWQVSVGAVCRRSREGKLCRLYF